MNVHLRAEESLCSNKLLIAIFLFISLAVGVGAFGLSRLKESDKSAPPRNKKVNVLVRFVGTAGPAESISVERRLGRAKSRRSSSLRAMKSENTFSMTEIAVQNGGAYRSLLGAFKDSPELDRARCISVMVVALPGPTSGELVTQIAVLDSFVYDIVHARNVLAPPGMRLLWMYEDAPTAVSIDKAPFVVLSKLERALISFHGQYEQTLRTGEYRDVIRPTAENPVETK